MYNIIETGGKQYKVSKGDVLLIEKVAGNKGDKLELDSILTANDDGTFENKKSKVKVEIIDQIKDKKIIVFKYKAKKNVRKKQGHRQKHTKIRVI